MSPVAWPGRESPWTRPRTEGRPFSERSERVVLAVIGLDIALQLAETVPDFVDAATYFYWAGLGTWLWFTIEWIVRMYRAAHWRAYAFSFYGIIDFLAILPLWLFAGFDLKTLRAFRLFRLFRAAAKLAGRTGALAKMARAFIYAKEQAGVLLTGTVVVVVAAGLGMFHLEHDAQPDVFVSALDGLWWAVITLTTVGYGDIYPVTPWGKVLGTAAMFAGIGVIGATCGIMADALREASKELE